MNSEDNIASCTMLGCLDICRHTTVLDNTSLIFTLLRVYMAGITVLVMQGRDGSLKRGLVMYINCLSPAFSTTVNGWISHTMKLPIASTKVFHRSLSFGNGLPRSKTFHSVGCDSSTSLPFSPSAIFASMVSF